VHPRVPRGLPSPALERRAFDAVRTHLMLTCAPPSVPIVSDRYGLRSSRRFRASRHQFKIAKVAA
jgi:hypothetical protein